MIITRVVPIPDGGVRGFTVLDGNGDFNVYINASLSAEMQTLAYLHELEHIRRGDFEGGDVDRIEKEVHDGQTAPWVYSTHGREA